MKNKMNLLKPVIILLTFIVTFVSCQTGDQKEGRTGNDVTDAEQNLKEVTKENEEDRRENASADEWKRFKEETDAKIKVNEEKIEALTDQMKSKGRKIDDQLSRRIDTLQMKNRALKNRLDNYDMKTDWKQFQSEFNRDMDELGKSLKDFTVNNK